MVVVMGGESDFLREFEDATSYRAIDEDDVPPAPITFMADWIEAHGFAVERG